MKIMAFGSLKPMTTEQQHAYMPTEVPQTLQLYLDGKLEQFWLREEWKGVFFLLNVASIEEADLLLNALPLAKAGLMTYELMPVGPLAPLGMLLPS